MGLRLQDQDECMGPKLPAPTRFSGGITATEFRVAHFRRRTPIFEALDRPGHLCRLRAATLAAATITAPASSERLIRKL
jgi:hypothetical protein